MVVELNTTFNDTEKNILQKYTDHIDIKIFIDTDKLDERFIKWDPVNKVTTDEVIEEMDVKSPNRMIGFDGFWFVESKNRLGSWHMGSYDKNGIYSFWGNYGDLEEALKSV